MKIKTFAKTTAISTVLLLAFTACGSDSEAANTTPSQDQQEGSTVTESDSVTFAVGDTPPGYSAQEVRIEVADDLLEVDQQYAQHRNFDSVIIQAADLEAHQCSVEIVFEYAPGVAQRIHQHDVHRIQGDSLGYPAKEMTLEETYHDITRASGDDLDINADSDQYIEINHPVDCASHPGDRDASESISLRYSEWDDTFSGDPSSVSEYTDISIYDGLKNLAGGTLAEVEYTVMANGDIQIIGAEIDDWMKDSNDMWLED